MWRNLIGICLVVALCGLSVFAQQPVPIMRTPAPNVTVTGPQRQQPPARPQTSAAPVSRAAPSPVRAVSSPGTVAGYVYWDTKAVQHDPPLGCNGLTVTVSIGTPPNGSIATFEQFKPLGTYSNFTYLNNGSTLAVCAYSVKVPEGRDLQVQVAATPSVFSPVVAPATPPTANNPNGPFKIPGGTCNKVAPAVPSPSVLSSHWWTCGDYAYNVNFVLQAPGSTQLMSNTGGQGLLSGSAAGQAGPQGTTARGMLAPGATPAMQQQVPSGGFTGGVKTSSGAQGHLLPAKPDQKSLTNADVIKMVKGGIPESVIVSSVQSATKQFDFSSEGCRSFQQARVSSKILVAMGDGSASPCPSLQRSSTPAASGSKIEPNPQPLPSRVVSSPSSGASAVELNPQPLPPRTTSNSAAGTPGGNVSLNPQPLPPGTKGVSPNRRSTLAPVKLAPPKALRKVSNPRLAQQNASIEVLEQQRQAAQQESAAMNAPVRTIASAATARIPALSANLQGNVPPQGLAPAQTQSSPGNITSSITHAPAFDSVVLVCSTNPTLGILRVNGAQAPGIFTPEAKYNHYTIVGCSFGQSKPGNLAYISSSNGFKANLNIDFWSENAITAHFDPWLAGVLDQDNVTLVVAPSARRGIQKSGFKFYAARGMPAPDGSDQEVPLAYNSVSQSRIKLFGVADLFAGVDQVPSNATSKFPSFSFQGTPVAGWAFRYVYGHDDSGDALHDLLPYPEDETCYINDVIATGDACIDYFYRRQLQSLGADTWDFSTLALHEFVISSYALYYEDTDPSQLCGAWDDSSKDSGSRGSWDFNLTASNQITVTWPLYWCTDQEAAPFNRKNRQEQSAYGLAVWVLGPRCMDPWTGQKDQNCMNKVKQILG